MCTRPITMFNKFAGAEVTVSCGTCDACVAVRRHNWVMRAMAEKAMHPQTFVVALTYSDATQHTRDGAAFFRYHDVRIFLARLREEIKRATEKTAALRFIVAGEQGSENGRCHWHVVLFSDVDLLGIGVFTAPWGVVTEYKDIVAKPRVDMPRGWDLWPHGFVQVQEPDEGGMHYAMSYALKDQFNAMKSEGSHRISKSEAFATGLFRMSKNPPIGAAFIDEKIYSMYQAGNIEPNTKLHVPHTRGYWFPSGPLRIRLLEGMRRVNNSIVAQTGRNAAQWRALVIQCQDNESDLDALGLNIEEEHETSIETEIDLQQRQAKADAKTKEIAAQCGGVFPCILCLRGLPDEALAEIGVYYSAADQTFCSFENQDRIIQTPSNKGINKWCGLRDTKARKQAFPQSAGGYTVGPAARCGEGKNKRGHNKE